MTTEEIEKAIERFTEGRRHKSTGYPPKEWFKAGIEAANKHWQEKTRWIPVEERLPEVRDTPYCIAIKWEAFEDQEERVGSMYIYTEEDIEYMSVVSEYWKEIE